MRWLFWWSFAVRFGAGLTAWVFTRYFELPLMQDALFYEALGASLARDWLAGQESAWLSQAIDDAGQAWGIVVLIGVFYFVTRGVRAVPVLLAFYSAITAWTPVLTHRIARRLGVPSKGAWMAALLVAVSPGFAFWSGALYKEGLVLLALNLGVYSALRLQTKFRWQPFAALAASILALLSLRFYLAVLLAPALGVALLLGRVGRKGRGQAPQVALRQLALAGAFLALMVAVGFTGRAQDVAPTSFDAGLEQIQASRHDLAGAHSGYLREADVSTPARAIQFLPLGLAYFLTVPLPWHLGGLRQNLVIPETLFWVLLYPLIFLGMKQGLKQNFQGTALLLLVSGAMCGLYALFSGNIGVTYRMRTQVWLLWAVFAGWGWRNWRERIQDRRRRHLAARSARRKRRSLRRGGTPAAAREGESPR